MKPRIYKDALCLNTDQYGIICTCCEQRQRMAEPENGLLAALESWDRLFVWDEPFEGYDEEIALHRAFRAQRGDA